mmetsp:Transcript_1132/g.3630  ORF Transcript_1132/g.3630 Transcript_1132/m.3630 type:complete len:214 (-) Transcript_1132:923-1564(-)
MSLALWGAPSGNSVSSLGTESHPPRGSPRLSFPLLSLHHVCHRVRRVARDLILLAYLLLPCRIRVEAREHPLGAVVFLFLPQAASLVNPDDLSGASSRLEPPRDLCAAAAAGPRSTAGDLAARPAAASLLSTRASDRRRYSRKRSFRVASQVNASRIWRTPRCRAASREARGSSRPPEERLYSIRAEKYLHEPSGGGTNLELSSGTLPARSAS